MNATILHESRGAHPAETASEANDAPAGRSFRGMAAGKVLGPAGHHPLNAPAASFYTMTGTARSCWMRSGIFPGRKRSRPTALSANSSRALNREFEEKLIGKVLSKAACTLFLPSPLRIARILWHMIPFVRRGLGCLFRRRMKVELLDAPLHLRFCLPQRLRNRRYGDVPAGGR